MRGVWIFSGTVQYRFMKHKFTNKAKEEELMKKPKRSHKAF